MAQVTTQAPKRPLSPARQKVEDHISKLSFDLTYHAGSHTLADQFDPFCAECIYWAAKIVQHHHLWNESYVAEQTLNLRPIQPEIINFVILKVNQNYPLKVKAHEWTVQEYLQAVGGQ